MSQALVAPPQIAAPAARDRHRARRRRFRPRSSPSARVPTGASATSTATSVRLNGRAAALEQGWESDRWRGIERAFAPEDVLRLQGSVVVEHTLARLGAERLWSLLHDEPYVRALGALSGGQAVQMVKAGLKAIYLSGWQVAADGNLGRRGLSGSEPLSREQRPRAGQTPQQRAPPGGSDRVGGGEVATRTGSRRSSPTRKPGSAARSTRSSS